MVAHIQVYPRAMNTMKKDRKNCFVFYYFNAFWHHTRQTEEHTEIVFSLSKLFPINPKVPWKKKKITYKTFCLLRKCKIIYTIPSFLAATVTFCLESLKRYYRNLYVFIKTATFEIRKRYHQLHSYTDHLHVTNLRDTGFFLHQVFPVSNGFKLQV